MRTTPRLIRTSFAARHPLRAVEWAPVQRTPRGDSGDLGCVVVRRVTDDHHRAWTVRTMPNGGGVALFFACDVPGVASEIRRAPRPLEQLTDDELLAMLQRGDE